MSKLEEIRFRFHFNDENEPELQYYGQYKNGLTQEEVKDYLRVRANNVKVEKLYKKFGEIAGVNTMSGYQCPHCDFQTSLMYRHDVLRFADVLFGKTNSTYFD